jgi:hypothetical protein
VTQQRRRPAPPQNRPISISTSSRSHHPERYDHFTGMQCRAAHKRISPPISVCGCIRDPLFDKHRCGDEITDAMAEAAVMAAEHLELLGTPGLFDRSTCQAITNSLLSPSATPMGRQRELRRGSSGPPPRGH